MELDPEVVTPEAFSTLLDMIYTSTLSLRASNVMDVLLAASHLHLNTVVKACKLHISRKNFPATPPKGWRSVQRQQHSPALQVETSASLQNVTSAVEEDFNKGFATEVTQSGGGECQGTRRTLSGQEAGAPSPNLKRKSQEERLIDRKRSCGPPGENYKECSPTITMSSSITEEAGEELLSPDCFRVRDGLWEGQGNEEEEVEQKYEAAKGESEEIQLPSQSDSRAGGVDEKDGDVGGETVVKVKVGEEGEEEGEQPQMALIEVKKENLSSFSPDLDTASDEFPPSPLQSCTDNLNDQINEKKLPADSPTEAGVSSLQAQLCTALHTETLRDSGDLGEHSVDGDGLDGLSELAFSCFLNPGSDALEEEDSLATLTAAAASATTTASDAQEPEEANTSAQSSDSSSVVFPVTSVPMQQLLPTQSPGFGDTLILQPAQNPLTGFLSGIKPGLTLEAPAVQSSRPGKSPATTTFRRIAPKVPCGSEANADPSGAGAADRPALTRASEDVLSKCKKAAAEDHVLLVEGEKKYACKICCKTFMNLTDCKKHIRVHTGEKPYPCPRCGKRFSQSSHLYKHSKNTCLNWRDNQLLPDALL
ncbi:zinc finger and BTB domain-containing protein 5-like isoform X2 [Betta splendens]|nr:zinc finger and BTB domain-containing protein 5-like isoform X2 [Betta splendens]